MEHLEDIAHLALIHGISDESKNRLGFHMLVPGKNAYDSSILYICGTNGVQSMYEIKNLEDKCACSAKNSAPQRLLDDRCVEIQSMIELEGLDRDSAFDVVMNKFPTYTEESEAPTSKFFRSAEFPDLINKRLQSFVPIESPACIRNVKDLVAADQQQSAEAFAEFVNLNNAERVDIVEGYFQKLQEAYDNRLGNNR